MPVKLLSNPEATWVAISLEEMMRCNLSSCWVLTTAEPTDAATLTAAPMDPSTLLPWGATLRGSIRTSTFDEAEIWL